MSTSGGYVPLSQTSTILGVQPPTSSHYPSTPPLYPSTHTSTSPYHHHHMNTSPIKVKLPSEGNKLMNQGFHVANFGEMSPGGVGDGIGVKVEEASPYSVQNNSPFSAHGELVRM